MTTTATADDELLLVDDIARLDKNCPETIRRQVRAGTLPAVRIGRQIRIWKSEWRKARESSRRAAVAS
jgi:excisionase family DNA binding protein